MPLFQKSVVNKYLSNLDSEELTSAYNKFQKFYGDSERIENIKLLKEENYQEGFLREIFVEVLGYTINPDKNYNLTTEYKNETDSKKADGAILQDGNAIGVIELKSTKTINLESITTQAFNYKNHQSKCRFVITSNFEKLRFYIDNATEWEEFNLFTITEDEFKLFYLLLSSNNLLQGIPRKLKEESRLHEEEISDKLYRDYSEFKHKIYNNLVENNSQYNKLVLFKKSQKLLDRLLFVLFAEDSGLVPPNAISQIVDQWKQLKALDEEKPLYSRFVKFFNHLNVGHTYEDFTLPAYNGGLFSEDEILDNVEIDDEVLLEDILNLSSYDFSTEVDVNILGHIFEHSLAEIEEITAQIEGTLVEREKSKRKKDGIFYTPKYITKYIVDNTVGALCYEKRKELNLNIIDEAILENSKTTKGKLTKKAQDIFTNLDKYREYILSLKILDPACGSGAFLNQALEFLINEHSWIDEHKSALLQEGFTLSEYEKDIVENNLYGVDINEEAVEIAKLSLWLRTAKKGRKLSTLSNNIKCGNSLIDDSEVAGDKAFNWDKEFSEIMSNGGFDVVIGNPPYGAKFNEKEKKFIKENYQISSKGKIDSYKLFFEFGFDIMRKEGYLSYITPNTFLYNVQSKSLRNNIIENYKIIEGVELRKNIFTDAPDVVPVIINIKKEVDNTNYSIKGKVAIHNYKYIDIYNDKFELNQTLPIDVFRNDNENKFNFRLKSEFLPIKYKIEKHSRLHKFYSLKQGTKPFGSKKKKDKVLISNIKLNDNWENSINGRNIARYSIKWNGEYVKRSEELHSCLSSSIIDGEKIYFQRMRKISLFPRIVACYDNSGLHGLYTCSVIYPDENKTKINIKYVLALMNSKLINYWYKYFDTDIEIKLISVKQIPIPEADLSLQNNFSFIVDGLLLSNNYLNKIKNRFINRFTDHFELEKISQKLQSFYDYDFKQFRSELKKQKVTLSLKQQDEWEDYFNEYKAQINQLQEQITKTDNKIDVMVYILYGLTYDEVKIVDPEFWLSEDEYVENEGL